MIFIGKISKGPKSVKYVGGVTLLFLCTSSDSGLYLNSFMKIFLMVLNL